MAMITGGGGGDSGVETENESNDLDLTNINIINDPGAGPIIDLPDSGPSSSESDLNQQLHGSNSGVLAAGSSFLGPDITGGGGSPSILLKDKGDEPPPPPPPTSPNICGTGGGVPPDFLDGVVSSVQNFTSDSLDGMIDETEEGEDSGGGRSVEGGEHHHSEVSMDGMGSSQHQSIPVIEDEIMERDDASEDEDDLHNHHHPYRERSYSSASPLGRRRMCINTHASPFKRILRDIDDYTHSDFDTTDDNFEGGRRYTFSFSSTADIRESLGVGGGGGDHSKNTFYRARAMSDSIHHPNNNLHHHHHHQPPPAPPVTPTNVNNCRALVKFEFPQLQLPKLVNQFEPPAGLHSFTSLQPFQNDNHGGYAVLNSAPSTNDCRALIPYEQKDLNPKIRKRTIKIKNKLYQNWTDIRKEYNEKRLRTAAGAGNFTMVQKLLTLDVDPNASDEMGRTALHVAACKGYSDIVSLLISSGASPNARDCVGNTPLHLAACTNHFDVVTCLLRAGTDVSTLDNNGRNPLQLAQSKLKLLANWKSESDDAVRVKNEVRQIVEMILEYLQKKGKEIEAELLNDFANRLTLSTTAEEVDADVKNLLANLSSLTINVGGGGSDHAVSNPIRIPPKNPYLMTTFNPSLAKPRSLSSSPTSSSLLASGGSAGSSSSTTGHGSIIKPAHFIVNGSPSPTPQEEQKQLISNLNRRRTDSNEFHHQHSIKR